jgi:Type II secretion system (T2SS), protein M subtype b
MIGKWQDVPWIRPVVFLGLNLAACLAVLILIAHPIYALFAEQDVRIAMLSETLARMNAIANQKSDVEALARQVDAEGDLGEFLAGANEGVVNAALQARLKTMTEAAGARIRSVQGLAAKNNGEIRYIGARIDLSGALGAVHKAIYAVESGKPYLFVSNASIRLSPSISAQAAITEPVIDAQLDVFGAVQLESPVQ